MTKLEHVSCALCGKDNTKKLLRSKDLYIRASNEKFTLVRCKNCGLTYVNPRPTPEALAAFYPDNYPPYSADYEVFSESRVFNALRKVKRLLKPQARPQQRTTKEDALADNSVMSVLDYGCGSGRFLLQLQKAHPRWKLSGFDMATNTRVQTIGNEISLHLGSPTEFIQSIPDASFDAIYLNNVLEHLPNPIQTLKDLHRILKDDGTLHIEVPNIDSIKFKIFGRYFSSLDMPRHLYHFNEKTLRAACEQGGFSISEVKKLGTCKSTVRSAYFALGISKDQLNPLAYSFAKLITTVLGERRIDDDSLRATARKM